MSNLFSYRYQKNASGNESGKNKCGCKEQDTKGKTETFWTRNVKAITFFICLAVFLAAFGPWSVFRIMDAIEESRVDGKLMDAGDVLDLAENRDSLYFSQFEEYHGEVQEWEFGKYYIINIEETYLVMVGTEMTNGRISYFTVTHIPSNEEIDVMGATFKLDDLKDLLKKK